MFLLSHKRLQTLVVTDFGQKRWSYVHSSHATQRTKYGWFFFPLRLPLFNV